MPFAKRTCSVKLDVYVGGALPRNRSRTGTIEPERLATSSVCVYVFLLVCRASMQAFKLQGSLHAGVCTVSLRPPGCEIIRVCVADSAPTVHTVYH